MRADDFPPIELESVESVQRLALSLGIDLAGRDAVLGVVV